MSKLKVSGLVGLFSRNKLSKTASDSFFSIVKQEFCAFKITQQAVPKLLKKQPNVTQKQLAIPTKFQKNKRVFWFIFNQFILAVLGS